MICLINLKENLIEKSIEAFVLSLEVYNKPTIKYRVEGFSFFIVNAWELMLKAELIKRGKSVYYKDKPDRTLSINDTIKTIYSDNKTRVRLNLEKIIELRNISTHFITQEYEIKYIPLFQACVINYINEINRFHSVDITKYISSNFLTLVTSYEEVSNNDVIIKYPPEIAQKFIREANEIDILIDEIKSEKFAINVKQNFYITKRKDEADFIVTISNNDDKKVKIIKDTKNPNDTHKLSYNDIMRKVNDKIKKDNLKIGYKNDFNSHVFNLFINFYDIKNNEIYSFAHIIGNRKHYTYSQNLYEFIINEIKKSNGIFYDSLKNAEKKITPGT